MVKKINVEGKRGRGGQKKKLIYRIEIDMKTAGVSK